MAEDYDINLSGFDDIAETSQDLAIGLDIGDDFLDIIDIQTLEGFEYPCMLISGIKFIDTLRVLQSVQRESYRSFDVWIDLGDGSTPSKQGKLPADLKTLLTMRYLGLTVTMYLTKDNIEVLNLNSVEVLEKFI